MQSLIISNCLRWCYKVIASSSTHLRDREEVRCSFCPIFITKCPGCPNVDRLSSVEIRELELWLHNCSFLLVTPRIKLFEVTSTRSIPPSGEGKIRRVNVSVTRRAIRSIVWRRKVDIMPVQISSQNPRQRTLQHNIESRRSSSPLDQSSKADLTVQGEKEMSMSQVCSASPFRLQVGFQLGQVDMPTVKYLLPPIELILKCSSKQLPERVSTVRIARDFVARFQNIMLSHPGLRGRQQLGPDALAQTSAANFLNELRCKISRHSSFPVRRRVSCYNEVCILAAEIDRRKRSQKSYQEAPSSKLLG